MNIRRNQGNYTNPCLTMHQPWASLLVYGIKRVEGRSWPAPIRGRLWIHAAGKVPEESTIRAMEEFYREIYAVNGITDIKFPENYPVSRLVGCVDVVGCLRGEELKSWKLVPEGVRLEALTELCWLCEQPQKLLVPFEMRGYQRVYNLERGIYEAAVRGLTPVNSPLPVKFPLPNPRDLFSLRPGSISARQTESGPMHMEESSSLAVAIAGARAAANQFSKRDHNFQANTSGNRISPNLSTTDNLKGKTSEKVDVNSDNVKQLPIIKPTASGVDSDHMQQLLVIKPPASDVDSDRVIQSATMEQNIIERNEGSSDRSERTRNDLKRQIKAPSKIFAMAVREIKR